LLLKSGFLRERLFSEDCGVAKAKTRNDGLLRQGKLTEKTFLLSFFSEKYTF
jgi:hypothetical protein